MVVSVTAGVAVANVRVVIVVLHVWLVVNVYHLLVAGGCSVVGSVNDGCDFC